MGTQSKKRDLATVLATDHNETLVDDFNFNTPQDSVFGDNTSCILWPSLPVNGLPEGPYCE